MVKLQFSLILACVAGQLFAANPGEEWTRFRGPNGTGVSSAKTVPTHWTKADYNWSTPLAGDGSSSPVVWGPNIFVTANDREKSVRSIVCVESKTVRFAGGVIIPMRITGSIVTMILPHPHRWWMGMGWWSFGRPPNS